MNNGMNNMNGIYNNTNNTNNTPNMNNYNNGNMNMPNMYNAPNNMGYQNMVPQQPKNNTAYWIIAAVVTIFLIGFVVYFFSSSSEKVEQSYESYTEEKIEEKNEESDTNNNVVENIRLHGYSEYQNYNFTMSMVIGMAGETISSYSVGTADVKNKTDKMTTTVTYGGSSATSYSYSDYVAGYTYTSDDNIAWIAEEASGTESINLEDIINKINNGSRDVTTLENGHYKVKIDFDSEDITYEDVIADVYVTNGYISKLSYDLTSIVESSGYDRFTVDFTLSDFNVAGNVVIPASATGMASSTSM